MEHREAKGRNVARRYMANELSTVEREDFEQHYFDCAECADSMRAIIQAGFAGAAPRNSDRGRAPWARLDAFWSWRPRAAQLLAPACLALAFTSYEAVRARGRFAPQSVTAHHLLADARGAERSIDGARSGEFVVLTADVPELAQEWKWQIRRAEGGEFVLGGVAAAQPGGLFNLLIPVARFNPGRYVLSLRDNGLIAPEVTYRFRML